MANQIESDATIASVLSKLKSPERYVCGVLANLYPCRKAHGNAAVRIGITGKGMMPYYRVIFDAEAGKPDTDDRIFAAFFDNHTPLEWTTTEASNKAWSSSFLTFEEVQALIPLVRPTHLAVQRRR